MRRIFTICLVILMSLQALAQDVTSYQSLGLFPQTVTYAAHANVPFDGPEIFVQSHFVTDVAYGVKVLNVEQDNLGFTHYRLQQTLNGYPIEKSMLLVHVKDGKVVSANGEWFKSLPGKKKPSLSSKSAFSRALNKVKAKAYIWETSEAKDRLAMRLEDAGEVNFSKPEGELVYMNVNNELNAASLKLAYKFDIFAVDPFTQEDVYIDAESGDVIFSVSRMHHANTNGTAQTGYYGAKPITVDQSGSYYYARQSGTRRIELYNMNGATVPQNGSRPSGSTISSTSSNFSFSGNARYYMDAYWGAEVTYDFFKEKFNRNSYNNAGGKIDMFVNGSGQGASNNAFWFGSFAYFGNSTSGTPFTSLDVVSHEITHGVTGNSARLIYQGESGALNEAFSDIFGCYAEHYAGVGQKWVMGEYISFQRSMSNPNQHRQPDTYRGSYWASTTGGDNGGVHTNSGVMNYWFYLVSEGGSGSNDNGASFSVDAIGIENASQIAYRALTSYLTSSSGYSAARTAVINAARDLYGNNSCEVAVATDAMHAVGVGSAFSGNCSGQECSPLTGLSVSGVSSSGATVSWNSVSGISSYTVEYKPTTSSSYTSVTASSSSRTLSGLNAGITYDVRVRYTCSNGTTADYASTTFTTQSGSSCNAVAGLTVSGVTTSGANIAWNPISGISSYSVGYKLASSSSYTTVTANGSTTSLSGLNAGQDYDVRVSYTCTNGQAAPYASSSFTTSTTGGGDCDGLPSWTSGAYYYQGDQVVYNNSIYEALYFIYYYPPTDTRYWTKISDCGSGGTCDALTGLNVSNIGQTSAVVSWSGVSGINSYSIEYKLASASNYTATSSSSSSFSLTGLTPNSTYTVRVRYSCSNGQTAPYSNTSFTTEEDTGTGCDAVTGLTATSITENSAQLSWNGVSGVSSYTLDYKATADANYQSATINGTTEPYTGLSANTSYSIRVSYTCSNGQTSPLAIHQFTTTGSTGGECSGVETYQSGKYYHTGEQVVYQGNLYEAQADYIYWPPSYGWWTNLGPCQGVSSYYGAVDDSSNPIGEMSTFNIYPNATRERVNVQFVGEQDDAQSTIRLIDTSGNLILYQELNTHKGLNQVTIDLPSVDPGVYFIQHNGEIKRILIK